MYGLAQGEIKITLFYTFEIAKTSVAERMLLFFNFNLLPRVPSLKFHPCKHEQQEQIAG